MYRPAPGVWGRARTLDVSDFVPGLVVANVWRLSTRIPIQKEARPMMMMHGLSLAGGRCRDLQDADESVLEYDSVAAGRCGHSVIPLREIRFILSKTQRLACAYGDQDARNYGDSYLGARPIRTGIGAHCSKSTAKSNRVLQFCGTVGFMDVTSRFRMATSGPKIGNLTPAIWENSGPPFTPQEIRGEK